MPEGLIRTPDQRLRVFISSTLGELAEERQAARSSVEQLRLAPVMFELGARPHPPRALYRSYLEQSDVFVGIYWQRYGWVAPGMEISGLEDEFVLSGGMPRLIYVKRPAPDMEPGLREMLSRLEIEDSASYRPFGTAEELHGLLLDDLAVLLTERFDGARAESRTEPQPRQNLPAQASTFLGREAELRELRAIIGAGGARLVTLTGPGGSGKTRLGLRVAAEEAHRFAEGVFFVDLSTETESEGTFAAVARAVGVTVAGDVRPVDALTGELHDRRVLLVLDNFEQAMSAAVGVAEILERCPEVHVLVTSREALRLRGEHVFAVPPLSLPEQDDLIAAGESEAVRLFCERAAAVRPGFELNEGNAEAITAICRGVDGLPLAIELAAARMRLFDIDELRQRLGNRLDLLRGGARDLPKRQQTLRDAIAWSYDLLPAEEQRLLCLFAAFSGGRLADLEETAQRLPEFEGLDVIEALGSLVDKSLVRSTPGSGGGPRFSTLQTIRAYAMEQLEATPDFAAAARHAHASQYTEVALRLQSQLTSATRADILSVLSDELGNMRSAWDEWARRTDLERLNALLTPLWGYYDARGDYRSAIELGHQLLASLATTPDSPERRRDEFAVRMSVVRTNLAVQGFTPEAEAMIRDALEGTEAAGDARQRFAGLRSLGYLHMMRVDFHRMAETAAELTAIAEEEQDPALLAEAHLMTGHSRIYLRGLPAGLEAYRAAVKCAEAAQSGYVDFRVGTHPEVVAKVVSGLTQWMVGEPEAGLKSMRRALALATELEHPYSMAYALHHATLLDLWNQDLAAVRERTEALLALAEAHEYPTWRALAGVFGGVAMVGSGKVEKGLERVEEGFELYRGLSAPPVFWPALLMLRALALLWAERHSEALAAIEQAEAALPEGDPLSDDIGLLHGDVLLAVSPVDVPGAEEVFERVARMAGERGGRMAVLQALTRLAALRRGTAAQADALQTLRDLYDSFTEGFETPPLVAARAVIEAGAGPS